MKTNYSNLIEFKIISKHSVNESAPRKLEEPLEVHNFFMETVRKSSLWNPDKECFVVLFLNVRSTIIGFEIVSVGTVNASLAHPREVFRQAIVRNATSIVLIHNHPSGDCTPSEPDIKITRDLIRAGQLLQITVFDHVIVPSYPFYYANGRANYISLRELGYFYN